MCLVSKTMRSSAMRVLFATITLASKEDFYWWLVMLSHTPELGTGIVREMKISSPQELRPWHRPLRLADPSLMPPMRCVRRVMFESGMDRLLTAMSSHYLSRFPNMSELHLSAIFRDTEDLIKLLGACGRLEALSLSNITVVRPQVDAMKLYLELNPFDLSTLETLVVDNHSASFISDLLNHSQPVGLKSLTIVNSHDNRPVFPTSVVERIFGLGAHSLQHFTMNPIVGGFVGAFIHPTCVLFAYPQIEPSLEMFRRLPPLPALISLTIWLVPSADVREIIDNFPAAHNMRVVTYRVYLPNHIQSEVEYVYRLNTAMGRAWKWDDLVGNLSRRFPRFEQLKFQFYVPRNEDSPYVNTYGTALRSNRPLRGRMESTVRETIKDAGDSLSFEWFNHNEYTVF